MSIQKNYIYNTLYQLFTVVLPLITVPYISRVLSVDGVGLYGYTSSYTQYFILLGMLGITLYGRREIAYVNENKRELSRTFCDIYTLQLITSLISYSVYIFLFVVFNSHNKVLYLTNSLLILGCVFDISWFFIGIEHLKSVVIRNMIVKVISIVSIFIFVRSREDVVIYALILGLSTVIGQLIMWLNLKSKIYFIKPSLENMKLHFIQAGKLLVSQLAIQIYVVLDKTMLGIFTNDVQVGLYDNSQKLIKVVLLLVTSIAVVLMPRMSTLYAQNKMIEFRQIANKAFSYINFIGIPITAGLMAIANEFSVWFYGNSFEGIEQLLIIGSVIIIAISWSNMLGMQIMIPMKREKEFTLSVILGAIVNFSLNIILIKQLGAMGSTLATVIAEIAVTLIQIYFLRNFIDFKYALSTFYKPVICTIPMYITVKYVIQLLPVNIIGTFLAVIIGISIYFTLAYVLRHELMILGINEVKKKLREEKKNDKKV